MFYICSCREGDSRKRESDMRRSLVAMLMLSTAWPALAAETITYTYDAKGRVVKVVRTGTVNNNVTYDYTHDRANNRTNVKVTNSP